MTAPLQPGVSLRLRVTRDAGLEDNTYSTRPYAGTTFVEGRVRQGGWGPIRRALSDDAGQPQMSTASVLLNDDDGAIRGALDEDPTRFLSETEAVLSVLSQAGRAAALAEHTLLRGRVDEASVQIDRQGFQRKRSVRVDLVDALAPHLDETIPKHVMLRSDFPDIHRDLENTPFPLIGGEHSDYGSEDVNGNSAEKGLVPAIYVGGRQLIAGSPGSPEPSAEPSFLTPPVVTGETTGSPAGSSTLYYGVTKLSAVGESVLSNIVTITTAPATLSPSDAVELTWSETEDDVTGYWVYGRRNSQPVRRLAFVAAGGSPLGWTDDGTATEFAPGPPEVNTAQVPLEDGGFFWDFYVVCLGVVEITGIYGSNVFPGVEPKRILLNETAGVDFLIPGMSGWPHAEPYIETASGLRITGFYGRGPRSQHHKDGVVTIGLSVCGYEDVGDGSGDSIQQAFPLLQLFLNEHVLKNGGEGYTTGNWGPLETWGDSAPMLQTSAFTACQDATIAWIGGDGYLGAIYLRDQITVRQFLQWFYQTFDAFGGVNHHGQYMPVLYDPVDATVGRIYRHRMELLSLGNPELDTTYVEPRISFQYDYDPDAKRFRSEIITVEDATAVLAQPRLGESPTKPLRWTRDAATASDAMERRNNRLKYPRWRQTMRAKYNPALEDELGEQFRVTHPDGPMLAGYSNRPFLCVAHEVDPNAGVVTLTGYDLARLIAESDAIDAMMPSAMPFAMA